MRILVFLHGTLIMHKNAKGHAREEIVKQVVENERSVKDYISYIPIGNSVQKINTWKNQGAEILYISSHENSEDIEKDKIVLKKHGFPKGPIYYRREGEEYHTVAERIKPDVIIEDDAKSIGGEVEMVSPKLNSKLGIKSIIIREFEGIDHLPNKLPELLKLAKIFKS